MKLALKKLKKSAKFLNRYQVSAERYDKTKPVLPINIQWVVIIMHQ